MDKEKLKKTIELFGLSIGLSSVICNTLILIFNKGFIVGVTRFIPESNQIIRFSEIGMGLITTLILIFIIINKIMEKKNG